MPDQNEPRDTTTSDQPPRKSNQEQAKGSRGNTNVEGGGISNRPIADEQAEQQDVPPRGSNKDGAHA